MSKTKVIALDPNTFECGGCYWHALASVGIYSTNETVPRNLRRKVIESYDREFYESHEKGNESVTSPV
jgi:hypothetical protein